MPLREDLAANGAWLFRHRSYLPLLGLGLVLTQLPGFSYLGNSHATHLLWSVLCLAIGLLGLLIRIHIGGHAPQGTSSRGTHAPGATQVTTTGFYSVVRHPLYLANLVMWLGVAMFVHVWWLLALLALAAWLYYERIMFVEEEMLRDKFGPAWLEWAERTPALLPRLRLWKAPDSPFYLRHVLRREYGALFALIATFTGLEVIADFMVTGKLQIDLLWGALFALAFIVFIVFRWLAHHTNALDLNASRRPATERVNVNATP
jgi:protein-S-isoprenylcysteine O-methyltransferase Ste14